jgi:serine/alanine adding enzyme
MEKTIVPSNYKIATSIEDSKWDDFVYKHPQGNIFQTRFMYEVYLNTKNYQPINLFVSSQDTGQLCGVLCGVIINESGGILKNFSSHSIIQGGPLILSGYEKLLLPLLVKEYDRLSQRKTLYCEIRNMYDVKQNLDLLKGYIYEDHLNYLIRLNQPEDILWRKLHRAKKNHINKAMKMGVNIKELNDGESLTIFYRLIKETYNNAKIPLADYSLFKSAFDILSPKGMVKYIVAEYENKTIGAQVFLTYKDTIFAWYLGASKEHLIYHPNEYLTWWVFKWGKANGYKLFDFGGAGKPGVKYGPRNYKREFGGEEVNYGRNKIVYKPLEAKISNLGFRVYRKLLALNRNI